MISCPQCGAQNLPGMAYCENCGSPLPQQTNAIQGSGAPVPAGDAAPPVAPAAAPVDPAAVAVPQPVMPVDQPPSGPDMNVPAPTFGANAVAADATAMPATAAPTDQAAAAPAAAGQTGGLVITFPNGQAFTMQGDEANVGRADVAQNWHPELDVIPFGGGAPDLGVSRHHARLIRQDGDYAVVDLGSTNGTYINGKAVPYNQPTPLHNGDTLSFGALNTQVAVS